MFTQGNKAWLLFWLCCCRSRWSHVLETLCVSMWEEEYSVWPPKRDHTKTSVAEFYLQHRSRPVQHKYSCLCCALYRGLFSEPGRVQGRLYTKAFTQKWGDSSFTRTVWRVWLAPCKYVFIFNTLKSHSMIWNLVTFMAFGMWTETKVEGMIRAG